MSENKLTGQKSAFTRFYKEVVMSQKVLVAKFVNHYQDYVEQRKTYSFAEQFSDENKCVRFGIIIYNESRGWAPRKRNLPLNSSIENNGSELLQI